MANHTYRHCIFLPGPCRHSRNRILADPISRTADMDLVGPDPDRPLPGLCPTEHCPRVEKGPDAVHRIRRQGLDGNACTARGPRSGYSESARDHPSRPDLVRARSHATAHAGSRFPNTGDPSPDAVRAAQPGTTARYPDKLQLHLFHRKHRIRILSEPAAVRSGLLAGPDRESSAHPRSRRQNLPSSRPMSRTP